MSEGVPVSATDELRERLAEVLWASEYPAKPGSVRAAAHLAWVRKTATELLPLVVAVVAEARTEAAETAERIAATFRENEDRFREMGHASIGIEYSPQGAGC